MAKERERREAKKFTDISLRNLKPEAKRYEVRDLNAGGLYVVVSPSGHRSFVVRFRFQGQPRKLSLGSISLAAARKAAGAAIYEVKEGRDPSAAKQQAKVQRRTIEANTFQSIAEQYLKLAGGMRREGESVTFKGSLRTAARRLADLERLVFPTLGDRPIAEIKRSEIVALLDKIEAGELTTADGDPIEGGPVTADRTLATIRKIMNWYAVRADDFRSPIVRGMERTKGKERARDRTLTDDELRAVWKAAGEGSGPFPPFLKLLLLTGARRDEAARMEWSESDGSEWTLPASRNKVKVDLIRPLSKAALDVIESQRNGGRYVFSTNDGKTPISAFSKFKKRFDKASGTSGWTLHDLRRSARSLMSRVGVNSDHAERCLGHVIGGIRGVYDRHEYHREKKEAYDALAALIERIANPPEGNVTPLRKKKRA